MSSPPSNRPPGHHHHRQSSSWKITSTQPQRKQTWNEGLFEESVSRYDLTEKEVRNWLKIRFRDHVFERRSVVLRDDRWILTVPERLTETEKQNIEALGKAVPEETEPDF